MGWASYLETIVQRWNDTRDAIGTLPVGPAGSPLKQIHTELDAAYQRLRRDIDALAALVERNLKTGQWLTIANMMDDVVEDADSFSRRTVLLSGVDVQREAAKIQSKKDAALLQARNIEVWLTPTIDRIETEARRIHVIKTPSDRNLLLESQRALEKCAVDIVLGWKRLLREKDSLDSRGQAVEVTVSDSVFVRMMATTTKIVDKDSGVP